MVLIARYGGGGSVEGGWLATLILGAVLAAAFLGLYLYYRKKPRTGRGDRR